MFESIFREWIIKKWKKNKRKTNKVKNDIVWIKKQNENRK